MVDYCYENFSGSSVETLFGMSPLGAGSLLRVSCPTQKVRDLGSYLDMAQCIKLRAGFRTLREITKCWNFVEREHVYRETNKNGNLHSNKRVKQLKFSSPQIDIRRMDV